MKLLRRRVKEVQWRPSFYVGRLVLRVHPNDGRRLTTDERLAQAQQRFRRA